MMKLSEKIKESEIMINEKLKHNMVNIKILGDDDVKKCKIIILKDKKIDRCFQIELVAYRQINIIENNQIIEDSLHIGNLGRWLYNLYNPVEILYVFYGGKQKGKILTRKQVDKIAIGKTNNIPLTRMSNISMNKKKIDNQPIVNGYLGPMFERIEYGKIYLRYETQEIYDMLSA